MISGQSALQVLAGDKIAPDFEISANGDEVNFIHRRVGDTEIYFIANRAKTALNATCTFRVNGKVPELWNAVTGETAFATNYTQIDGRTSLPLEFAPCGSWLVVFRAPAAAAHPANGQANATQFVPRATLEGAWQVSFDPKWGGPNNTTFETLQSWTKRAEDGIRFYSGTATYRKTFDVSPELLNAKSLMLDLGQVKEIARVRLNGKDLGIVWSPPFRVNISGAAKATGNQLEIEVVNFWPNRIIGDASLPVEKRFTQTNVQRLNKDTPLMESGLLGPVQVLAPR